MSSIPFDVADAWRIAEGYADMAVINTGGCENFAQAMNHHIPNGELVGSEDFICWDHTNHWVGGHCWLYDGKLHYDSQALNGVDDWRKLPFFSERLNGLKETICECSYVCLTKEIKL